jgi:hypothetical protein
MRPTVLVLADAAQAGIARPDLLNRAAQKRRAPGQATATV